MFYHLTVHKDDYGEMHRNNFHNPFFLSWGIPTHLHSIYLVYLIAHNLTNTRTIPNEQGKEKR